MSPTKGVPGKKRKDHLLWHSKYGGKEGGLLVLAEGGRGVLTWRQRGLSEGFYSGKERRRTCVFCKTGRQGETGGMRVVRSSLRSCRERRRDCREAEK